MQNYNYVDTNGATQTVQANSPEHAISIAPNRAPDSGVQLFTGPAVVATNDVHRQGAKDSSYISNLLSSINGAPATNPETKTVGVDSPNYTDAVTQGLDTMSARNDAATNRLIQNVTATRTRNANAIDNDYNNYKSGLQLLGIQHNEAQFTPDLLAGHIKSAENDHMQKIQNLDAELNKAVADATDAQANNDFKTLQEKTNYIKTLKQDQKTAINDMYSSLSNQTKASDIEAHQIYDSMQSLSPDDQEAFIHAVANKFNLPVTALVQSLADEKSKRATSDLKTKSAQVTYNNKVSGGGSGGKSVAGSGGLTQNQIDGGIAKIKSATGADGFAPPELILQAWNSWKGTPALFKTKFGGYINPKATGLPVSIMPKNSSSSTDSILNNI